MFFIGIGRALDVSLSAVPQPEGFMPNTDIFTAPQRTISVILAGGRGTRLMDLTSAFSKPGLDFGGKFRIIDFTLSNCINSGFRKIEVLTQYNSHRLLEHLQFGWTFLSGQLGEFVHVLPAQQSLERDLWYSGTADAVYQNIASFQEHNPENVLILAGDHVYKMDYRIFLQDHLDHDADMTIACLEVPKESATDFGVAQVDEEGRIVAFVEKSLEPPTIPGKPTHCLASMGIYLFKAIQVHPTISGRTSFPIWSPEAGSSPIASTRAASKTWNGPPIGGMWARWMPTGRPTWTSPTWSPH
jgi:glucose-1-phosphate adenylyltransferase